MTAEGEPAHDIEIEKALLGALLMGAEVPSGLRAEHLYYEAHRAIFRAVVAVDAPDELSAVKLLRDEGKLDAVGGASYVSSLTNSLPDVANAKHHAGLIRSDAAKRELHRIGRDLQGENGRPVGEVAQRAMERLREVSEDTSGTGRPSVVWRTLREYQEHPELLQPPEVVVPNLAWRGRITLLAAREKSGKSTFAAFGAALLSKATDGGVLWVNLEEAPFDVVNRFEGLNADPDRVMVSEHLPNKLADLEAAITKHAPDLVVIDTLAAWGVGRVTDWNAAAQVTPVMLELVELARRHNIALVIVHHGKKVDGSYRDSTAIGASVDVIVEMSPDDKDDHVRHFKPKGRWTVEPFSLRWTGAAYESVAGETPVHDRVYQFIETHPGCSKRVVRDNVSGRTKTKDEAIERLIRDRQIKDHGDTNGAKYYATMGATATFGPCPDPPKKGVNGATDGHGMGTPPCDSEKPNGARDGHGMGTGRGTPPVPRPLKGGCGGTVDGARRGSAFEPGSIIEGKNPATATAGDEQDVTEITRPELPEYSGHWPKHLQKRLRELVGQGHRRLPATEIVKQEYAEGVHG